MKNIYYSDVENKIKEEAHKFATEYILEKADEYDKNSIFPIDIFNKSRECGLMYGIIPTKYGGRGLTMMDRFIIAEELSWACSGIAIAMQVQDACVIPFLILATEKQRKKYFKKMLDGRLFSMAFTEPDCGSDLGAVKMEAKKVGDKYILNGKKTLIASVNESDYIIVFANIINEKKNTYSFFIVDTHKDGVINKKNYETLGQCANHIGEFTLCNYEVAEEDLLGNEDGLKKALQCIEYNRSCCGAVAIGIGRRAMEESINYARKRNAFGRPIWKHEAIGHIIADMDIKLQAARLLGWLAVKNMEYDNDKEKYASYAKVYASDSAMEICTSAVQIFGGYGIIKDYKVEKLFRDVKSCQLYEGTSQIHKNIIIKELMKQSDENNID